MAKLSFYTVDVNYCDYMRSGEPRIIYNNGAKLGRPFVGLVFDLNGISYYAPLTSPKPKHEKMKNNLDFLKIAGGQYGAINFNNMMPIHPNCLTKVEITIKSTDSLKTKKYKNLLMNELSWCNSNQEIIINKAKKLYDAVNAHKCPTYIFNRCCNFRLCEQYMNKYVKKMGWN